MPLQCCLALHLARRLALRLGAFEAFSHIQIFLFLRSHFS